MANPQNPNIHKFFSLTHCKSLYDQTHNIPMLNPLGQPVLGKDLTIVKAYVSEFFIPITTGEVYQKVDNKYELKEDTVVKKTYFKRLPKEIGKWFFEENLLVRRLVSHIHETRLTDDYFNVFEGFKHPKKDYSSYSPEIKAKVEKMNQYVREVLANNNEQVFQYIIKWYANVAQGKKNDSCLYFKGPEGTGKSTLNDFLIPHVFGKNVSLKIGNTVPLLTKNNKILMGKVLVVFEELPTFTEQEWAGVSSKLKDMITGQTLVFGEMREKQIESENMNNYVMNSNDDAIKHSEGRRYFIADISTLSDVWFETTTTNLQKRK
jgi:hypothetical protein